MNLKPLAILAKTLILIVSLAYANDMDSQYTTIARIIITISFLAIAYYAYTKKQSIAMFICAIGVGIYGVLFKVPIKDYEWEAVFGVTFILMAIWLIIDVVGYVKTKIKPTA